MNNAIEFSEVDQLPGNSTQPQNKDNFHNAEVERLKAPLAQLLTKIKPNILAGAYDQIIGEDTGGRLPALVLWRIINQVNSEQKLPHIPLTFLHMSSNEEQLPYMLDQVNDPRRNLTPSESGKKKLVVTEHVASGRTLGMFKKILEPRKVLYDVATISSSSPASRHKQVLPKTTDFFYGDLDLLVSSNHLLTGYVKRHYGNERLHKDPKIVQSSRDARTDIALLSKKLFEEYFTPEDLSNTQTNRTTPAVTAIFSKLSIVRRHLGRLRR